MCIVATSEKGRLLSRPIKGKDHNLITYLILRLELDRFQRNKTFFGIGALKIDTL